MQTDCWALVSCLQIALRQRLCFRCFVFHVCIDTSCCMLRGLQLDPLSEEPHDNSASLQSCVTKAVAPAWRGKYRKLQLPSQHLALAPTAHTAAGGRLTRSAAADAAAAEVMLGLAGASACSATPSHDPSPTVGTASSLMGPPSTAVSPVVDQGPVATASLSAA